MRCWPLAVVMLLSQEESWIPVQENEGKVQEEAETKDGALQLLVWVADDQLNPAFPATCLLALLWIQEAEKFSLLKLTESWVSAVCNQKSSDCSHIYPSHLLSLSIKKAES